MPAAALIPAIAGAGAIGGAVKGAKGTPAQNDTNNSVTKTTFAPASQQERDLQQQSIDAYMQQQKLAGQAQGSQAGADQYQQAAQRAGLDVLNGTAFSPTNQEQQQIADLRNALLQQSQGNINQFLQQGQAGANNQAALRGLRGQAASALQGQVLKEGSNQYGQALRGANTIAAQQALQLPQQRIAAQSGLISQGLSLGDILRQKAFDNQQTLQNPMLLAQLQRERIAGNTQTTSSNHLIPGVQGGLGAGIGGFLSGGLSGAAAGANIYGGINALSGANSAEDGDILNPDLGHGDFGGSAGLLRNQAPSQYGYNLNNGGF